MAPETEPFDAAKYLTDPTEQEELLREALASGEAEYVAVALGTIARARGMSDVAKKAGVTREALYKALSPSGDPRLSTLMGVLKALDFRLGVTAR